MQELWDRLLSAKKAGTLDRTEARLAKRLAGTLAKLAADPGHNSLQSHEIAALTRRYGMKVFQSYLENNTPAAGRLFSVYGLVRREITIIGLEPHPAAGSRAYDRVLLSKLPLMPSEDAPKPPIAKKKRRRS